MSDRTLADALRNAERIRGELPVLIQPSATDYDMVVLADEIERLRADNKRLIDAQGREGRHSLRIQVESLRGLADPLRVAALADDWHTFDELIAELRGAADQPPAVSEDTALLDWADASGHHDCLYHSLREELRDQGKRLGDPMPDGPCPLCKGTGYYAPSVKADQPGCSCNDPNPRECCWNDDGEPCRCACHTTADNSPATSSPPTPAAL